MVNAESRSGRSYSASRLACLAGAATVLPFAAHADSIQYSGIQNISESISAPGVAQYTLEFVPGDTASDFQFNADFDPVDESSTVSVVPAGSNAYLSGSSDAGSDPTALTAGAVIDGNATYSTGTGFLQTKSGESLPVGPWPTDGSSAFLGITFTDPSLAAGTSPNGVYYGWVDLSVSTGFDGASFTITDWAYETTGNAISAGEGQAPEPSSLMLFALGAAGVAAVRARRLAARA